ncbi:hypothetical protein MKX03_033970 [Papaver bracteatum]|nr:hypothetical protein MKX03_033970 [Papaver bracteatum]
MQTQKPQKARQQISSECLRRSENARRGTCFDIENEFLSSTDMDGGEFCLFDRSVIVFNGILHSKVSHYFFFLVLRFIFIWIIANDCHMSLLPDPCLYSYMRMLTV